MQRYINHSKRKKNCRSLELRGPVTVGAHELGRVPLGLYVQTCRDVAAGEELLIDYGPEYWTAKGIRSKDPRRFVVDYL